MRYDCPTEESSELSQERVNEGHGGHPWTAYRAPTPLPPFGSEEYYQVIKSSNPSPTSSNESEIGSTPEEISSKEELFLPGPPPDLPESPYATVRANAPPVARINAAVISANIQERSFVPVRPSQGGQGQKHPVRKSSKKSKGGRTIASSGEEAVGHCSEGMRRTLMNKSDPVLSSSSSRNHPQPHHHIVDIELQLTDQRTTNASPQKERVGSPPLLRQSATTTSLEGSHQK